MQMYYKMLISEMELLVSQQHHFPTHMFATRDASEQTEATRNKFAILENKQLCDETERAQFAADVCPIVLSSTECQLAFWFMAFL